ncbi:MAG: YceI family protein [Bacteroidetes bacterium]|nr:YceI family protein [Bacteroidota bacterium]
MVKQFSISAILIAFLAMSFAAISNWKIADNSAITFKLKSLAGSIDGSVGGLKGSIVFDPNTAKNSKMDVTFDLSTIRTGIDKRDNDLKKNEKWFDIAKYPLIAFKSNNIAKSKNGYIVDGTLTIKGISKDTQVPFAFSDADGNASFTGTLKINRLDFNLGQASPAVKDDVEVAINVPVKK